MHADGVRLACGGVTPPAQVMDRIRLLRQPRPGKPFLYPSNPLIDLSFPDNRKLIVHMMYVRLLVVAIVMSIKGRKSYGELQQLRPGIQKLNIKPIRVGALRCLFQCRSAVQRGGAPEIARLGFIVWPAAMHGASIVPDHQIAPLPAMAVDEALLRGMGGEVP